jgi:glycosyltransferase involved in cell wall biosynthesis
MGDHQAIAKAVLEILNNPSLRKRLSDEGRKRAQDFSITNSMEKYEKVFQELENTPSI